ncbi:MAG: tRNA guanosine(34) transglycosylase Tgt [Dehalococcoidia bacterium]|nr:tRNA guanosine(34) transglycosylase Tgt [Dehalococcoidia bacterium]
MGQKRALSDTLTSTIEAQSGRARAGRLVTRHGVVSTPCFMPVGTQATVKSVSPDELARVGAPMILANTYHLLLRPGPEIVAEHGGLHRFMAWDGPILTDSGGFQVWSLARLRRIDDDGVTFRSHVDGSEHRLTPARAMAIQAHLGADVVMALDECVGHPATHAEAATAVQRTNRWLERCLDAQQGTGQALFGIVQGSTFDDLRTASARAAVAADLPGYAIGGLSVGESKAELWRIVEHTVPILPADRPRYLMGVGSPEDLIEAVGHGIDLFDCVLPTRAARHGGLYTDAGRLNIRGARFRDDLGPIDPSCDCSTCRTFTASYVHHLFRARELLAFRLATVHNLRYFTRLMERVRTAIANNAYEAFRDTFLATFRAPDAQERSRQHRHWQAALQRDATLAEDA